MSSPTTRRFFLGAATAAAATRVWGANDRINVAIIGLGGRGGNHVNSFSRLPESRVVGLCDVNQAAREQKQAQLQKNGGEKAKEFVDMRDAFAEKDVDAVSIATPNHWHALATIWACRAGKDVYCEKPASHNIYEALKMIEVARQTKRMVQIGSQHRSWAFKMKAIDMLKGGAIGKLYLAKGLCYKRRQSIGHKPDAPVPPGVNWDLFLGPAPMRAFNELRFKYNWHWFWDTGNGDIGNQGVHQMGVCLWAMGDPTEWPKGAVSSGGKYAYTDDQETPNTQYASIDLGGGREISFEVRGLLTGGEGAAEVRAPRGAGRGGDKAGTTPPPAASPSPVQPMSVMIGNLFYGTEGWAAMDDRRCQLFKGEGSQLLQELRSEGGDSTGEHMKNFLAACRSRNYKEMRGDIGIEAMSASYCHLANISYRVGRKLTLEAGPKFKGDAEANKLITREYRKPYVVA